MGDIAIKNEHILMVHSFQGRTAPGMPELITLFDRIRKLFPDTKVTLFAKEADKVVPKELWEAATILITLFDVPQQIEDIPNVHLVHLISAGSDHLSSHPIITNPAASNIIVTTSSGIHGPPIAEWVIMSSLVLTKNYNHLHDLQKKKRWGDKSPWFTTSGDWVGKTVGILGYGSIGRQVARAFSALGANIHAYNHFPRDTPESKKDNGYIIPNTGDPDGTIPSKWYSSQVDTLHTFLKSGLHAVVICTPLTKATTNLLTSTEFSILQESTPYPIDPQSNPAKAPGAIVINISRGKIINQPELIEALKSKTIKAAALDVTDPEPLPSESELWGLDNVVISPHMSSLGTEYLGRSIDVLRLNMERLNSGGKLVNVVDKKRGY